MYKMDNRFQSIRVSDENASVTKGFHFFTLFELQTFCVPGLFIEREEVVGIFHAKRVIVRSSVYSLTIAREKGGNRDS